MKHFLFAVPFAFLGAVPGSARVFQAVDLIGATTDASQAALGTCGLTAGRDLDGAALQGAVDCLGGTGLFTGVDLRERGNTLEVSVSEAPQYTGLLDISATLDNERGLSGKILVEDTDLFNSGLYGGASLEASKETVDASARLARTGLFGGKGTLGFDITYSKVDFDDQPFAHERLEFGPNLGFSLSEHAEVSVGAGLTFDRMFDVAPTTRPIIARDAGERRGAFLEANINYDIPLSAETSRLSLYGSARLEGYNDGSRLTRVRVGADVKHQVASNLTLLASFEAGKITTSGKPSRITDRFQLGGDSLRGFAPRGIGPRNGGIGLGGDTFATASVEIRSHLFDIAGMKLSGGVFAEAGSVWGLQGGSELAGIDASHALRSSAGVALQIDVKGVPLTVYYAKPIRSQPGDVTQPFGLSVAASF